MPLNFSRRECLSASLAAGGFFALGSGAAHGSQAAKKIKLGQIGVGHAHANKLSVYRASDDYEMVGIVEPDEGLRKRAANSSVYRDLPWMTEEQLLNTPGLQAVLVETHVRDLLPTAKRCIDAGKHVHLDKPAGESLADYRTLLAAAEKRSLLVQMGYMYRYSPAVILLKQMLRDGWLGELFEVHTVMSKVVGGGERKALAEYPGGIMFELGCHIIDQVLGILGKPERVTAFPKQTVTGQDKLLDNMLAVFDYPRATASVKSAAVEVDGGSRRHFVACGTHGTFHIQPLDAPVVRLTLDRPRGEYAKGVQEVKLPKFPRYVGDAADMARIIRGEKASDYSYAHDLAVQETLLRACGLAV